MATTHEQLDSFHRFAKAQLENGGADLSFDQLVDLWRIQNPTPDELRESVLAVKAAIRDMEQGDTGEPAEDVIRVLRQRHGGSHNE